MQTTAAEYFGAMTAQYDSLIRRAVPRYEEMTERLLDYLPDRVDSILELGCGTGNLSLALAKKYPAARLTIVDAAPEMLEVTQARMAQELPQRPTETRGWVTTFETLRAEAGEFDLITSCISLHHVRDKAALYRTLHAALRLGGHLIFADQLRGGTERLHAINWRLWLEFCRRPGCCTEEETQSLLDHADAHDHYTPLAEHFQLLSAAGFRELDCMWRNLIWGIVHATA